MSLVLSEQQLKNLDILDGYQDYLKHKQVFLQQKSLDFLNTEKAKLEKNFNELINAEKERLIQEKITFSDELYANNYLEIKNFISDVQSQLNNLILKILSTLSVNSVAAEQISNIIKNELQSFLETGNITIKANADTINYLKVCIEAKHLIYSFDIDDDMDDGCCIVSDGKFVIFTDVDSAMTKIKSLIQNFSPVKLEEEQ